MEFVLFGDKFGWYSFFGSTVMLALAFTVFHNTDMLPSMKFAFFHDVKDGTEQDARDDDLRMLWTFSEQVPQLSRTFGHLHLDLQKNWVHVANFD